MKQENGMASLKDISKICGVSVATVSKALNDHKDIGEETKAKIASLEYIQNELNGIANLAK